jgi:hypothetical protein
MLSNFGISGIVRCLTTRHFSKIQKNQSNDLVIFAISTISSSSQSGTQAPTKPITMKVFLLAPLLLVSSVKAEVCERLKATLAFTQEKAPRDLSGVVSKVDHSLPHM